MPYRVGYGGFGATRFISGYLFPDTLNLPNAFWIVSLQGLIKKKLL
jgi:hypothetical protein